MRCLYCGKELALLKRWTGGGEFCSDAHRQQYQEEYNQLALNRLLQAKPSEQKPGAKPAESKSAEDRPADPKPAEVKRADVKPADMRPADVKPKVTQPTPAVQPALVTALPAPAQARATENTLALAAALEEPKPTPAYVAPEAVAEEVEPEQEYESEEDRAPAEPAGFLIEVPVPVMAEVAAMATSDADFDRRSTPTFPHLNVNHWGTELVAAGQVGFDPSIRVMDCAARVHEGRLEVREFVRGAPVVEFDLPVSNETGLMESSEEPMEILIFPHPPQGSPPLWQEPEREFRFEAELGAQVRVAFRTTGIQDNEDGDAAPAAEAVPEAQPEAIESSVTTEAAVEAAPSDVAREPLKREPEAEKKTAVPAPATPKIAVQVPRPAVRNTPPVFLKPSSFLRPSVSRPAVVAEKPAAVEKPAEKIPDVVTKPLPLTLHGLAAGRGKPVQVFPSAVASAVDLHIPRSSALPLRPVMILGPAPAAVKETPKEEKKPERTVLIKPDPRKQRSDPRFSGKGRKPEPEKVEPEKKAPAASAAAKEIPVPKPPSTSEAEPAKAVTQAQPPVKPEPAKVEPAKAKPEPVPEPRKEVNKENVKDPTRAPVAPAYQSVDLGLPSLSLDASGNFFSRLPLAGKIGASLAAALVIGGIFFLMSRGGGTAANAGTQVVVAGPALPTAEAGWITDWGAEPGVRKQHEISVLRASSNLTDYRLEFEAQIETKALGWVYRAKDPKNYYVNKLEIVKAGLEPTVALVRFAVINGEEQPRAQFPLSLPLHIDTLYKIRFDAVGDRFTTYVQDQKMDEWSDGRLKTGGIGLYNERGELMSVKGGVNVLPLVIKR